MTDYQPGDRVRMDSAFDRAVPYRTEGTVSAYYPDNPIGPGTVNVQWDNRVNRIGQTCYHIRRVARVETHVDVLAAAQRAADAACGDSNDDEIDLLRDALEQALNALGLQMPEGHDEDED